MFSNTSNRRNPLVRQNSQINWTIYQIIMSDTLFIYNDQLIKSSAQNGQFVSRTRSILHKYVHLTLPTWRCATGSSQNTEFNFKWKKLNFKSELDNIIYIFFYLCQWRILTPCSIAIPRQQRGKRKLCKVWSDYFHDGAWSFCKQRNTYMTRPQGS